MSASSAKASNIVPQIHLMVQTSAGVSLFNGPPPASSFYGTTSCTSPDVLEGRAAPTQPEPVTLEQFEWRSAESGWDQRLLFAPIYSPQGDMVCALHETSQMKPVSIYCAVTGRLMYALPADVQAEQVQFSPKGNFLVTWSRSAGSGGNSNLKVWYLNPQEGCTRLLGSFSQKTYKANVVQWTNDESYCCRIVSNEVNIYRTADLLQSLDSTNDWTVAAKVRLKGITAYAVAPVVTSDAKAEMFLSVVVFTPEAGGKPARATLFRYSCGGEGQSSPSCAAAEQVSTRTLFAANEAKLMWNVKATAVLVFSHADVAASSYYGATGLFLMQAVTDKRAGELSDCKVEQSKDGPVHAAAWSPTGDSFVVCAGTMPCHTTLHDVTGTPTFRFGAAHRNTIAFAPHGRFLCIAGFGNLAGEMDFYDMLRGKKIGSNTAHCSTTYCWSPDSRYFLTASLAPRMNVDNHIKLFKYNGVGPVVHMPLERAYDAKWRPVAAADTFANRGPSPKREGDGASDSSVATSSVAASTTDGAKAPYKAYRAPGTSTNFVKEALSGSRASVDVGKIKKAPSTASGVNKSSTGGSSTSGAPKFQPQKRTIPGMAPKAAGPTLSNAKSNGAGSMSKPSQPSAVQNAPPPPPPAAAAKGAAKVEAPPVPAVAEDPEKRVKNIRKKLKQIEDIKKKQAEGHTLEPEQVSKLATESALQSELAALSLK